jgi:hypothetical protein
MPANLDEHCLNTRFKQISTSQKPRNAIPQLARYVAENFNKFLEVVDWRRQQWKCREIHGGLQSGVG